MKFKKYKVLFIIFCLGLGLVACGKNENKGNLIVGVKSLSGTFNPLYVTNTYDSYVVDLVYDSLLSTDINGNRCASLAKELPKISDDYKTMTFQIREDVKFSNGNKLSAEDVVFTFNAMADPSYDGRYISNVENMLGYEEFKNKETDTFAGVELIDAYTVVFHFKEGYRANIDAIANVGIMNKAAYPDYEVGNLEPIKKSITSPVGSGPYKIKEWSSNTGAALVRNEYYDREGYEINSVLIKQVSSSTLSAELEKGSIDAVFDVSDPSLIAYASTHDEFTFNTYANAGLSWLTMNCEQGATADVNVRKALTLAFDRENFVKNHFKCNECRDDISFAYCPAIFQNPISSLHDYVMGTKKIAHLEDDAYNMEAAKKLLEDSGWILADDGFRYKGKEKLSIKVMMAEEMQTSETLIAMWKKDWKELGVDLKVTTLEFNTMIAKAMNDEETQDWNAFVLSLVFSSDDLDSIYTMFHSSAAGNNGNNFARLRNDEIDAVLDEGKKEFDPTKIDAIYLKAAVLIHNEYANVPIYGTQNFDVYNKKITNLQTSAYFPWTKALKDAKLK